MQITIPKDQSFHPPAGTFLGVCTEIRKFEKPIGKETERNIRLIFDLDVPGSDDEGIQYRVGINYSLKKPAKLRAALKGWLGNGVRGKQIDTASLRGKPATLEIVHLENSDFAEPFRHVNKLQPPLVQTDIPPFANN